MNILVVGTDANQAECRHKFGAAHTCLLAESRVSAAESRVSADVIFDFLSSADSLNVYHDFVNPLFINTSFHTLATYAAEGLRSKGLITGFCGLPTFLDRPILEASLMNTNDEPALAAVCRDLQTDYKLVSDRVGLVTPRVICMIINEAYFTAEEGTATKSDIDLAMKLGTNYPQGPFEWGEKIGLKHVVNLLKAVQADTHHERYEICPALSQAAFEEIN